MTTDNSPKRQVSIALPSTGDDEWKAVREPLSNGWLTQGPKVAQFEKNFAGRHEVTHAIATSSCTTGLHLILSAMGIGPGDEVIVPAFTWVSTANVVLYCGATPVLADVDPHTYNVTAETIRPRITVRTKAIVVVHLFGLCADIESIKKVAGDLPIIEDAACAIGSSYFGKPAGGLGLAAAFSFHPRKIVTTGEGGMVTTQSDVLAEKMVQLRNHGASISEEQRHRGPQPYLLADFNLIGFNYRLTDVQAAIGIVQLEKLEHFIKERNHWADFYQRELKEIEWLRVPAVPPGYGHGWQSFVCWVGETKLRQSRNELMALLQKKGISTRPGTHAIHQLGVYRERFGFVPEDYPVARDCEKFSMAIPLHNRMSDEDYRYVISVLKSVRY